MDRELGLRIEAAVSRERTPEIEAVWRAFMRGDLEKEDVGNRFQRIRSETVDRLISEDAQHAKLSGGGKPLGNKETNDGEPS